MRPLLYGPREQHGELPLRQRYAMDTVPTIAGTRRRIYVNLQASGEVFMSVLCNMNSLLQTLFPSAHNRQTLLGIEEVPGNNL